MTLGAIALAALLSQTPATSIAADPPRLDARAWLLIDASDGTRLAAHAAGVQLPVASATKLMTAYVAMRSLKLSERVTMPYYVPTGPESLLGLREGEVTTVRDLLYALVLASANDGAVALAEASAGSTDRFVERMNRTATALGLTETSYANPIGFDAPGTGSSARDLAELSSLLLETRVFERIADTQTRAIRTDRRTLEIETRNSLLTQHPWLTGVKTGYTLGADYVLVGSGTRKGVSLISVVLGAPTEAARDAETLELLEYGLSLYKRERVVREGERFARPPVDSGGTVPLLADADAVATVRRGEGVETTVEAPEELEGPIDRGERLGKVRVLSGGRKVAGVPLVAGASAPAPSLPERFEQSTGISIWVPLAGLGLIVSLTAMALIVRRRANAVP